MLFLTPLRHGCLLKLLSKSGTQAHSSGSQDRGPPLNSWEEVGSVPKRTEKYRKISATGGWDEEGTQEGALESRFDLTKRFLPWCCP